MSSVVNLGETDRNWRVDFVPKDGYISEEFARLEAERMWPRVWQVACRVEEIPKIGDYVTYNVLDDSIIVVRVGNFEFKAFHNVCQHRGRRLTEGSGRTQVFMCRFHGWTWRLDGSLAKVMDHEDWNGCPNAGADDLRLKDVAIDCWGGFVFINMDPDCEPLAKFLDPIPSLVNPFEMEKQRYRWYKSVRVPCNWKVALEAFNEGYHVAATHPQLLDIQGDDVTRSFAMGKHGMFGYSTAQRPLGAPSSRTGKPMPEDLRPGLVAFYQEMENTLKAIFTSRDNEAVRRVLTEVPDGTDPMTILLKAFEFQKEAAIASGAGWPQITFEQMAKAGTDWHVFPNLVFLMYPDGTLVYRSRPDGDNVGSCIFDIWSIARYAPGAEPQIKREEYLGSNDWRENTVQNFGLVLSQDLQNMAEVQRGMKSRGFTGGRTNPLQETSVSNFHKVLYGYLT